MTFPEPSPRTKQILRCLGAVSSLLFVIACLVPAGRLHHYSVTEDSWMQVLHQSFLNHLQFGTDIAFTYGPWGFLYGSYHPKTHLISVLVWLALAVIFWWAGRRVAQLSLENDLARWTWLMALASLSGMAVHLNLVDVRLMVFPLLLMVLHFIDEGAFLKALQVSLLISLGLLSLVKFSSFIVSAVITLIIAVDTIWRHRRIPWGLAVFGGSILIFWLLAGQRLNSFLPYLVSSSQITSGYTEAMTISHSHEPAFVCGFLMTALTLGASVAFPLWKRLRFFAVLPLSAVAFAGFTAFKYGFVRDDEHQAIGAVLLLALSLFCFAMLWPAMRQQRWALRLGGFLPVIAACFFAALSFERFKLPPFPEALANTFKPEKWIAPAELFYNSSSLQDQYQRYLAYYRDQYPLPPLKGDVDVYSFNQIELFANGLSYRPRPIFQSYFAYTPHLAEWNAAYLRSDGAAQTVLLDGFTLDDRYPLLEDGPSWPELLTRYDVQEAEISFVVLTRSKTPRQFKLTPLQDVSVKFGEQLSLPPETNAVVWAKIEIERTPAGRLISTLLKPPVLSLLTTVRSGQQYTNRLVPEMARDGFILSPFVEDGASFAALASTPWPDRLIASEVTACSIVPAGTFPPIGCYKNAIRIRLYRLDYPRQDLEVAPGFNQTMELKDITQSASFFQQAQLLYVPDAGSALGVPCYSTILIKRPKGSTGLQLSFGLQLPEKKQITNGVTFCASVLNAQQKKGASLWSRHLNPALISTDRGKQQATVELGSNEISRILLQTIPDITVTNDAICPYWAEIHFE